MRCDVCGDEIKDCHRRRDSDERFDDRHRMHEGRALMNSIIEKAPALSESPVLYDPLERLVRDLPRLNHETRNRAACRALAGYLYEAFRDMPRDETYDSN